jgi:hypothetical protein
MLERDVCPSSSELRGTPSNTNGKIKDRQTAAISMHQRNQMVLALTLDKQPVVNGDVKLERLSES